MVLCSTLFRFGISVILFNSANVYGRSEHKAESADGVQWKDSELIVKLLYTYDLQMDKYFTYA
jgi:hypothetical protein